MIQAKGKWALVTGASRGVGRQVALSLGQYGCNLILHSRDIAHTDGIAKELEQIGCKVRCVEADLMEQDEIQKMVDAIAAQNIPVDILCNVAGVNSNVLDFFHTDIEEYETIFRVNVFAIAKLCNAMIPGMLERRFGRVVNFVSSIRHEPKAMAYAASKAALIKLSDEMGYALNGTNVMLNMADPGWVRTDMGTENAPRPVSAVLPGVLLGIFLDDRKSGRVFHAEDYANMTLEDACRFEEQAPRATYPLYLQSEKSMPAQKKICSFPEFKEMYRAFFQSSKKKVVFGGGNQAKFFLDAMGNFGGSVDAILCSSFSGKERAMNGIPVYLMQDFPFLPTECIVVVAITEQHIEGVRNMLTEKGFDVYPSYGILYTEKTWMGEDGQPVSQIYRKKSNTFSGGRIGNP